MDAELLRRGCKAAGLPLKVFSGADGFMVQVDGLWFALSNPMVPSYVASLLVAKVREMEPGPGLINDTQKDLHLAYCRQFSGLPPGYMVATDEQRIRAALDALEGES